MDTDTTNKVHTLFVMQALEIDELKKKVADYKVAANNIYGIIYCTGGPLNDNKLRYNKKQMVDFHRIAQELGI